MNKHCVAFQSRRIRLSLGQRSREMQLFKVAKRLEGNESGVTLIETLVALAILGCVAAAFLSGLATTTRASVIADEQATAESLIRSEIEYIKNYSYDYYASSYPVDPALTIPESWDIPAPVVVPVHASDDGIQQVTVTAERNGKQMLSIIMYKADR